MIKLQGVAFRYQEDGPPVLDNLHMEIPPGQWLAVIGANGSGKSTLARHLNGLLLPQQGRVEVDGFATSEEAQLWRVRERVAFVFQNPDNQLIATSVEDDIVFGPENLGLPTEEIERRLEAALAITGLEEKRKKAPYLLSGGEKQRVAIAGALAMQPVYLVLDEPTSMLDPLLRQAVIATLQKLHRELGMGIIYVTNIMEEALLAQRVVVLDQGRVARDGSPAEVFADHEFLRRQQLDIPPLSRIAAMLAEAGFAELGGALSPDDFTARLRGLAAPATEGLPLPQAPDDEAQPAPQPAGVVRATGLSFTYQPGTVHAAAALRDFSAEIKRNELVALIGHSGSGKSTLAQLITGLYPPTAGELFVLNRAAVTLSKGSIFPGVGLVFQYPEQQLFGETIFEEVAFGPRNFGVPEETLPSVVTKALQAVGLDPQALWERSPFALSGGQKRRVCIASVLAMETQILIFDEPTAGLDEGGRQWMVALARQLKEQGKTIIWISHNMEEVAELADRIFVLAQGQLQLAGTPRQVFRHQEQLAALSLDIPLAAKLVRRLRAAGYAVPAQAVTAEQAAAEIAALLQAAGGAP